MLFRIGGRGLPLALVFQRHKRPEAQGTRLGLPRAAPAQGHQRLVSGASLGAASGAILAGPTADRFGRKGLLVVDAGIYAAGAILSAVAPRTPPCQVALWRESGGAGLPLLTVSADGDDVAGPPELIVEGQPPENRVAGDV